MARYQQTYANSCGAVALMCAASELGVNSLPNKFNLLPTVDKYTTLTNMEAKTAVMTAFGRNQQSVTNVPGGIISLGAALEKYIYAQTSGDLKSYSLPSRIVAVARLLGLSATMYAKDGGWKKILTKIYKEEVNNVESQSTAKLFHSQSPGPTGNQRELVVFSTMVIGLHYVMKRPSTATNQYMDPGDGGDHADFAALNTGMKFYKDTGLSIILYPT